ncbi:MAG TPA: hemerythrin domain-containing protein [Acidimicrobiia bacterium]|nr:hemerythrin domain-containing protein [Acidimicrobiia bacterium]
MDAITLLKADHKTVAGLFRKFDQLGERAHASKRKLVDTIIEELSVHAAVEEQLFYPFVQEYVDAEDMRLESLEEHLAVKRLLADLEDLDPSHERFDAKVKVLQEMVKHHVDEEEHELFPQVRATVGRIELRELGDRIAEAKETAPTRPHPMLPDEPPLNAVTGAAAATFDRARDVGRDALERVRDRVGV